MPFDQKAYRKEYYAKNKNKESAYAKRYRKRNKAKLTAGHRKWRVKNRELVFAYDQERYQRRKKDMTDLHVRYMCRLPNTASVELIDVARLRLQLLRWLKENSAHKLDAAHNLAMKRIREAYRRERERNST